MSKARGIIIFGANGSGKTTLGRELARILNFKHIDAEDYYFEKSDITYSRPRLKDEAIKLMLADIEKHGAFVLSSVTGDYGEEIASMYDLAIFLSAPIETRMERIEKRVFEKHGERVLMGGDMHEQEQRFLEFARTRNLSLIDEWAETLECPIIHVDGTKNYEQTAADIATRFYAKPGEPWRVYTTALGELKTYRY